MLALAAELKSSASTSLCFWIYIISLTLATLYYDSITFSFGLKRVRFNYFKLAAALVKALDRVFKVEGGVCSGTDVGNQIVAV
jgi:hypothetical protein